MTLSELISTINVSREEAALYFEGLGQVVNVESLWEDGDKDKDEYML